MAEKWHPVCAELRLVIWRALYVRDLFRHRWPGEETHWEAMIRNLCEQVHPKEEKP